MIDVERHWRVFPAGPRGTDSRTPMLNIALCTDHSRSQLVRQRCKPNVVKLSLTLKQHRHRVFRLDRHGSHGQTNNLRRFEPA
jgi:hypothetical protein